MDCLDLMLSMIEENFKIDGVITKPPLKLTDEDYIKMFNHLDKILKKNGTVFTLIEVDRKSPSKTFETILKIERNTNFMLVDIVYWHKINILSDNVSSKLSTRNINPIFIFARKEENKTYKTNKEITSVRYCNQYNYTSIPNIINAPAKDKGVVTFKKNKVLTVDVVLEILKNYYKKSHIIYDPFNYTGATSVACIKYGCKFIGSEIDKREVEYSMKRIINTRLEIRRERKRYDGE